MGARLTTQESPDHVLDAIQPNVALMNHDDHLKGAGGDLDHAPGGNATGCDDPFRFNVVGKNPTEQGAAVCPVDRLRRAPAQQSAGNLE